VKSACWHNWSLAVAALLVTPRSVSAAQFTLWPNLQIYGGYNNNINTSRATRRVIV
jgi:hypothetical protein